jgi:hypothetical protein
MRNDWYTGGKIGIQVESLVYRWKGWYTGGKIGIQVERLVYRWKDWYTGACQTVEMISNEKNVSDA